MRVKPNRSLQPQAAEMNNEPKLGNDRYRYYKPKNERMMGNERFTEKSDFAGLGFDDHE